MIGRDEALLLLNRENIPPNLLKHMIATEAVMKALADRLGEDQGLWSRTGLLHDLDYARTADDPAKHARISVELLAGLLPDAGLHAILAHCGQIEAVSNFDRAIRCADPVTGLVTAAVFMHPARKIASVDLPFMTKRFKERRFAAGANREQIAECTQIGIEVEAFLDLSLTAMQGVAGELGL